MSNDIEILKALPVLQKIWNTSTLSDYFEETIAPLNQADTVPEKKMIIDAITEETERLYGKETAKNVHHQITTFPVVETGTHLAFLRDYDSLQKDDLRSRLNQNVLISSALMRHAGQKYHVGVYGSNVTLNHPCGGGFFQLGDDIFPVTQLGQIGQVCLYDAPKIGENYFNESLPLVAKLKMLNEVLTNDIIQKTPTPRKEMLMKTKKVIASLLAPVNNGKANYEAVGKQYRSLNVTNQNFVKSAFLSFSAEAYKRYGYTFSDVDKQYQELAEIFNRKDLKLPEQVALVQSKTINKVLDGTGIQHVSIDAVEVTRKFLISSLENKDSLWYNIFNSPESFKQMQHTFVGIRGSWKENESPFDYVGKDKGFSKCVSLPLGAVEHKPETLLPLLKDKKIIPSSALMVLIFQSSGIMAHGGFFQTTYADKIKKRFEFFLATIGETKRAEQLQKLPVDMALLSLAVVNGTDGQPMKLSKISRMPIEKRQNLIDMIPEYPSCHAVANALSTLGKYLDSTAPGYIEAEAARSGAPQLICRHQKVPQIQTKIQENEILARSA
ncbi:MAG: hypothetical protein IKQ99_01875 [Alphaproteobacteria bacterium]|nr:hypothetical protein [Alphaproteobacteria bacterium]